MFLKWYKLLSFCRTPGRLIGIHTKYKIDVSKQYSTSCNARFTIQLCTHARWFGACSLGQRSYQNYTRSTIHNIICLTKLQVMHCTAYHQTPHSHSRTVQNIRNSPTRHSKLLASISWNSLQQNAQICNKNAASYV
jgi:hypothetical protein